MQEEREIEKYHDILDAILNNELPIELDEYHRIELRTIKLTLCWVMQHGAAQWLDSNMKRIMEALESRGLRLTSVDFDPNDPNFAGSEPMLRKGEA